MGRIVLQYISRDSLTVFWRVFIVARVSVKCFLKVFYVMKKYYK